MGERWGSKTFGLWIYFFIFIFSVESVAAVNDSSACRLGDARVLFNPQSWSEEVENQIMALAQSGHRVILILDHDGTFKEHSHNSELVWPTDDELNLIERLSRHPQIDFVFLTGRPMDWMMDRYGHIESLYISANHGVMNRRSYESHSKMLEGVPMDFVQADDFLDEFLERFPKARIEYKVGRVLHWGAYAEEGEERLREVTAAARELRDDLVLLFEQDPVDLSKWSENGHYFEILPKDPPNSSTKIVGKEAAGERILSELLKSPLGDVGRPENFIVLAAGDEASDTPLLALVNRLQKQMPPEIASQYISLKIGDNALAESEAQFWASEPQKLRSFLLRLLISLRFER